MSKKYIRTKDENNLIIDLTNMLLPYNITDEYIDFNRFGMFEIVKQADTIEELCDEFVAIDKGIFGNKTKSYKTIKEAEEDNTFLYDRLYGAIWTDKGLIYVAKVNREGELEWL